MASSLQIKFRQSTSYKFEDLVRDLIDFAKQMDSELSAIKDRLDTIEATLVDHESRITALEP